MKLYKWMGLAVVVALFGLAPAAGAADQGNLVLSLYGGWAFPTASDAVKDVSDTEFKNNFTLGGGLGYRFPFGLLLDVDVAYMKFDYKEAGDKFGALTQVPLMVWAKYQYKPQGVGFGGHGGVGVGANFPSFDIDDSWKTALNLAGQSVSVETDTSFVFGVNAGLDYFFTPDFSLGLEGKFLYSTIKWKVIANSVEVGNGKFNGHNISVLLGLKYWFSLN